MNTIAIVGLGLMGSSLGLALKKRGLEVTLHGYARNPETRDEALALGAVDQVFATPEEAVSHADVVVICVPIWSIVELAERMAGSLRSGAIVTDVGSTKSALLKKMTCVFSDVDVWFVGSHPIAGSEKTGASAGNPDLYEGRLAVVCSPDDLPDTAKDEVVGLWKSVGSEVVEMSAAQHDAMLASTSHLPHMVAAALARSVTDGAPEKKADFCGTGFKDTTRVASGSADMWVDIIDTNRKSLEAELDRFHEELQGLIEILRKGNSDDIRNWLEEAAAARDSVLDQSRFLKS